MRLFQARRLLLGPLLAAIAGCAARDKLRQAGAAPRVVVPAAVQSVSPLSIAAGPRPSLPSGVQLAAFQQDVATPPSPSPVEIIGAPNAQPIDGDRPTLPLDLATALGLTQGQNPRVAFAQAQIAQSLAAHEQARALWLPSIRAGMNYNKHEGRIQQVEGPNIIASRGAAYGGLGASAVGAGSPAVPGVYAYFHTADAIFQRRITGYALNAREAQSTAVTNDQLLETALTYLALLEAHQRKAIADET